MSERERSIHTKVRSLVSAECANHQTMGPFGTKDYCWMREKSNHGACVFFSDLENPKCRYFEEAVLPLDKDLKGIFSGELLALQIQEGRKRMIRKKCKRLGCSETFLARSNHQDFCPACQKWNENEKTSTRMANLRKKASGESLVTV